jgi:superfamily II RNA helicase
VEINDALHKVHVIAKRVTKLQTQFNIGANVIVNPIASSFVERWTQGETWESITRNSTMDEGDLVRQLRRVGDVLRQISRLGGVEPSLKLSAEAAHYQLYRAPVAEALEEAIAEQISPEQ